VAWGPENIQRVIAGCPVAERFEALFNGVHQHLGSRRAFDDMTLMMIDCAM
jgi:hypothetical protein